MVGLIWYIYYKKSGHKPRQSTRNPHNIQAVGIFLLNLYLREIYDAPMMIEDDISANNRSFRSSSMHKLDAAVAVRIRLPTLQKFSKFSLEKIKPIFKAIKDTKARFS